MIVARKHVEYKMPSNGFEPGPLEAKVCALPLRKALVNYKLYVSSTRISNVSRNTITQSFLFKKFRKTNKYFYYLS